jgi:2-dehydropantoate 2-reductase
VTPLILGAGSVGIGLASFLANDFCRPVLIGRPQTTVLIAEHGITRNGVFGRRSVAAHQLRVANNLADIHDVHPDVVCICVKTFDNDPVAAQLSAWPAVAEKPAPIILFQNGWGGTLPFETRFGKEQLFSARVITGFTRPVPNQVTITVHADAIHMGSIYGAVTEPLVELMNALNDGGMPTQIVSDIASDLWAKLFYNNALNSLGAILDVPYGALGDSAMTRPIMEEVTREGFAVMTALGYKTHWPDTEAFLRAFYAHMLPPTAAHISSTLQDIHRGTRTEIDYLNGAIVREGLRIGIPTPVNTTLYHLVRFLETNGSLVDQLRNE